MTRAPDARLPRHLAVSERFYSHDAYIGNGRLALSFRGLPDLASLRHTYRALELTLAWASVRDCTLAGCSNWPRPDTS
jgi:hypothetical protein